MNHPQFFKEGKWMPSFALLGNREIVFHQPIPSEGFKSSINRITLNPTYPAQIHLVEKLAQQLYELTTNINLHPQQASSLKMSHLRSMMSHVVKASELGTESFHNILYLTFKFLAFLVSKEAAQKMIPTQDEVTLESWLADVHSIYFEQASEDPKLQKSETSKIFAYLNKGEYQQVLQQLRCLYSLADQSDKDIRSRLDLLISILLVKLNSRTNNEPFNEQESVKGLSLKIVQRYKDQLNKLTQNSNKTNNNQSLDSYILIAKLMMGDQSANQKLAEKSWPLYLLHHISFGNPKFENASLQTIAQKYLKKTNNYGKASIQQTEFLFKLINRQSSHHIYQNLLSLLPMVYGHFLGYLLTIIRPSPVPNIYVQDYTLDLIRNLLDHSSQINFKTLVLVFASIDQHSVFGDRLRESFQCLLQHHLNIIDQSDQLELSDFISKVKVLSQLKYQRYAYFQLNLLLNNFLQKGKIDKQTLLIYSYCSMLYNSYYNYEDLLAYYLEDIFVNQPQRMNHLIMQMKNFKNDLQGSREKRLLKEVNQIEPLFERYEMIQ